MRPQDSKIRVLHVLDALGVGGAEQLVMTLADGVDRTQFHFVVCTLFSRGESPEPFAEEIRELGIRVEQLAMTRWRDRDTIRRFLELLDDECIDIVHGHTIPADFWGCFLARILGRQKIVCTKHDMLPRTGKAAGFQRFMVERVLAEKIISISGVVTDHLIHHRGVNPERIVQIPNPVDTVRFSPEVSGAKVREELGIPRDALVIGNTSRFEKRKGYDLFLELAGIIGPRHSNVRFLAVGHGTERDHMLRRINDANLQDIVTLTGPRRDIPQILGAIDIFFFTSLWGEGFGIVLIEAMAAGKAVVATNVGPAREIIEDGVSGFLPSPAVWVPETTIDRVDTDPLVERIEFLVAHPETRQRLGAAARRRAIDFFGTRQVVVQTEQLYRELLGR